MTNEITRGNFYLLSNTLENGLIYKSVCRVEIVHLARVIVAIETRKWLMNRAKRESAGRNKLLAC